MEAGGRKRNVRKPEAAEKTKQLDVKKKKNLKALRKDTRQEQEAPGQEAHRQWVNSLSRVIQLTSSERSAVVRLAAGATAAFLASSW